jgi:MoxR-like ATPase
VRDLSAPDAAAPPEAGIIAGIRDEVRRVIVGQTYLVDRLLITLLCNTHMLIEGVPGLAKSLAVQSLAQAIEARFVRVQFTPDLLPADLVGTSVFNPREGDFHVHRGPIFTNVLLADEINRAPAKVQSALLEAMQERQVSIAGQTFALDEPFMVLATQNPIEHEGTYPLPEAQLDRFMMKAQITYPNRREEREILDLNIDGALPDIREVASTDEVLVARRAVQGVHLDERLKDYIVQVVFASRQPAAYRLGELKSLIAYGASPRASIYLAMAARAHAFVDGRGYVLPDDVKAIAHDVLRHRVITTYEAEAEDLSSEDIIDRLLEGVEIP